jgi:hypothetical protein
VGAGRGAAGAARAAEGSVRRPGRAPSPAGGSGAFGWSCCRCRCCCCIWRGPASAPALPPGLPRPALGSAGPRHPPPAPSCPAPATPHPTLPPPPRYAYTAHPLLQRELRDVKAPLREARVAGPAGSIASWAEHDALATIMQWLYGRIGRGREGGGGPSAASSQA